MVTNMKIGIFADSHYCKAERIGANRRPALSPGKIREAMEAFQEAQVDMCICLGDLTDHGPEDTSEDTLANLRELMGLIRSYGIPFYVVPGNHDYLMLTAEVFASETGVPLPPYAFMLGQYRLIALDANYRSNWERFDQAGVEWTDANLPPAQVDFLCRELDEAEEAGQPCVILVHENLDPNVESRHIIKNAAKIREIIAGHRCVKLVLQGHYHWGAENTIDGIPYLTLPAMCEGEDNAYRVLEL